jgi:nitrogen-specific signal transduction histidine kinase
MFTGRSRGTVSLLERLNSVLVLFATWAAGAFFVISLVGGLVTDRGELVRQAMIPGFVLVVGIQMLVRGRPNALVHLVATSVAVAVYSGVFEPLPNVELGLLAMGLGGVVLVRHRFVLYVVVVGVALAAIGLWLGEELSAAVTTGLVFVFAASLFAWMIRQLNRDQAEYRKLFVRYRDMFELGPIAMWEFDLAGAKAWIQAAQSPGRVVSDPEVLEGALARVVVVAANRQAVRMFGADTVNDVGVTPMTAQVLRPLLTVGGGGMDIPQIEIELDTLVGHDRCLSIAFASQGSFDELGPDGVLMSARDVTDVVEAARTLEQLVESKNQFIATVSHELRTPITAVAGLTQELHDRFDDFSPGEINELLSLVSAQGRDVANIVEDLLVAARAEVGTLALQLEVVDLGELVESMPLYGASVVPGYGRLPVRADASRLRQILRNLLVNAERYGGRNRRIVLVGDAMSAVVEVRDDGDPIHLDERDRMFEAYQSGGDVPGRTGSVGLGLTVSRQLAVLQGGDLTYSHDGAESVFTLKLPLADG